MSNPRECSTGDVYAVAPVHLMRQANDHVRRMIMTILETVASVDCLACGTNVRRVLEGESAGYVNGQECPVCHEHALHVHWACEL